MPFNLPVAIIAVRDYVTNSLTQLSADTLGWLAAIVLHCYLAQFSSPDDWIVRSNSKPGHYLVSLERPGSVVLASSGLERHAQHHHNWIWFHTTSRIHVLDLV